MVRFAVLALTLALVGCGLWPKPETVRVEIPVPVKATAPDELLKCGTMPRVPVFEVPADPRYTSALTQEQEVVLREGVSSLLGCIYGWRAWASTDTK